MPSPATLPRLPLPGVPLEDQYTIQASVSVLKQALPPSYFTQLLALVTEGKAIGEAIRITGPNLVYVRFPINETGYPASFTVPRSFLVPLTLRPLARGATANVASPLGGSSAGTAAPFCGSIGGSLAGIGGNSFANHPHVELSLRLGEAGEPALCVVCGRWDEDSGKKRRSGHKCKGCVGQKSLERLRAEFARLSSSVENSGLNAEDARSQLRLVGSPGSPEMRSATFSAALET